ncbi:uncharacterized protein GGS22DRAFT_100299 [Annulohypoxylon maeteangense]|uniref:uncharacterized protein n=1 Tax=Annulohypoxylon maeteangense TaxID=1927788 RepID=UPI002008724A|nr:uncharacterized protein GGS22DRAFT_100299 [Annulohypoxylon maeteangense]KAI0880041.1 hypothetical protein GGS22DRAFT_100299 [Annulohypoxylon maeteangense]
MDPVSAFGVAGTIVQFIGFATSLVSNSSEILESANNLTKDLDNIDTVYGTLHNLSVELETAYRFCHDKIKGELLQLLLTCQADCAELLNITKKLKSQDEGKSRYGSLRTAIGVMWKGSKVRQLDERLQRTQMTLVLIVCSILSDFQKQQNQGILRLQRDGERHQLNQERQFIELRRIMNSIDSRVADIRRPDKSMRTVHLDDISVLAEHMQNLCMTANNIQNQQNIIDSLSFESRPVRHEAIREAHSGTFRWAFTSEDEGLDGAKRLLTWLKSGKGIFWVSGRPGSGKSTFMKYVADSQETRSALQHWSSPYQVVISSHYFWIFGTLMQKSREGLLRTLLYEIFRQCPSLLEACSSRWSSELSSSESKTWPLSELREVLHSIAYQEKLDAKICFFIDGLDEFDGDHLEISEDLTRLSQSDNIKICVSSRSWNVFDDVFGQNISQMLYIHELTRADIQKYVHDRLTSHPRWNYLISWTENAGELIEDVTAKSCGVFLWVYLVTNLLRNGLTNDDTLSDLSRRLASFPSDLESFFDHIMHTVDPFYHEKMAGMLRIAKKSTEPLDVMFYEFHDREYDDQDYALRIAPHYFTTSQHQNIIARTQRRINAYCKGLLEVHESRVEFLHRTVADFLNNSDISDKLIAKSAPWFQLDLSYARAHLAFVKTSGPSLPERRNPGRYSNTTLNSHVLSVMVYVSSLNRENAVSTDTIQSLLDEMEASLCCKLAATATENGECMSGRARLYFREFLVQYEFPDYLETALSRDPNYFDDFDCPPLSVLMSNGCPSKNLRTFQLLLEHGQNPNQEYKNYTSTHRIHKQTPWSLFIPILIHKTPFTLASYLREYFQPCLQAGMFELFLHYGADPNAQVYHHGIGEKTTAWIDFLFACFKIRESDETAYLRVLKEFLYNASIEKLAPHLNELLDITYDRPACENILKHFLDSVRPPGRPKKFIVQVFEQLVRKARSAGWCIDAIWPEVRKSLGERNLLLLAKIYDTGD